MDDKAKEYNTNFVNVMELDSMFRAAEVGLGAINRKDTVIYADLPCHAVVAGVFHGQYFLSTGL